MVPWITTFKVHPKGDQSWVFIERTDVEAETPILWPPDVKSWLIWKDPDAGKDWGRRRRGWRRGWNGWMASSTQSTWAWVNSGELVMNREAWRAAVHGVTKSQTRLNDLTELKQPLLFSRLLLTLYMDIYPSRSFLWHLLTSVWQGKGTFCSPCHTVSYVAQHSSHCALSPSPLLWVPCLLIHFSGPVACPLTPLQTEALHTVH